MAVSPVFLNLRVLTVVLGCVTTCTISLPKFQNGFGVGVIHIISYLNNDQYKPAYAWNEQGNYGSQAPQYSISGGHH